MKISKNEITRIIPHLTHTTLNKFWGLLALFSAIENTSDILSHNKTYIVNTEILSQKLEDLFYFGDITKTYSNHQIFFRLSKYWITLLPEILLKNKPNILDTALFYYKNEEFSKITSTEIVTKFITELNLSNVVIEPFFNLKFTDTTIELEEFYDKNETINAIKNALNINSKISTFSFEKPYFISSHPSELKRAPFIQTLYSGTKIQELLLLTDFNFDDFYLSDKTSFPKHKKQFTTNTIYYGSPGTGKSYKADEATKGYKVKKVTFHPDYDYHSFVGGYKPSMNGDKIVYEFVPQIFTKVYVEAWNHPNEIIFLQIEEINRGNCAEIFGDLFQLLDRQEDGSSRYGIEAEEELKKFLEKEENLGVGHEGINNGKIRLPPNLSIIATMNTSDQSLFPMDSAFKRRWDWEYVPINYSCPDSNFILELNNKKQYQWLDFLKYVNQKIFEITDSQDKQLGNWFVNAKHQEGIISEKTFINKVIFYLWNDVFKDEEETIFRDANGQRVTYERFFETASASDLVSNILEKQLGLNAILNAEAEEVFTES